MKRHATPIFAAVLLVHTVSVTASADEVQGSFHVGGGPLLATGLPEFSVSFMGTLGIGAAWPVSDLIRLGVRQELAITAIPYGNYDGEPIIGARGAESNTFVWAPTFLPSTTLWLKIEPSERVSVDVSVGVALLASSQLGVFYSLLPVPSGGAGIELLLSEDKASPWRLRAQCDVLVHPYHQDGFVLFLPAVGGVYTF